MSRFLRAKFVATATLGVLPAFALALFALSPSVSAQGRGIGGGGHAAPAMSAPHAAPAMSAPHGAMRSSAAPMAAARPSIAPHVTSGVNVVAGAHWARTRSGAIVLRPGPPHGTRPVRTGTFNPSNRQILSEDVPVPGLGFDFPHFAATHPFGDRDHDRGRFRGRNFVGAFIPFFGGGGYYMPLFPDDVEDESAYAPQQEVAQDEPAPYPAYPGYSYPSPYVARPPESSAPAASAGPEPQTDEYVFVRRDGTVFFAVAYTWDNGTLRYVTSEGLRRTVAGSALDLDATQQFNEQRGLNFHAPATNTPAA